MSKAYRKIFPAGGFQVPLSDGAWQMLASGGIDDETAKGAVYFLVKIERNHLAGVIRILAADSIARPGAGFLLQPFWQSTYPDNIFTFPEDCVPRASFSYWRLFNTFAAQWRDPANPSSNMTDLDRAAGQFFVSQGIGFSQDYPTVQCVRAETWGLLQADYLFEPAPAIAGQAARTYKETDWHADNIWRHPEKLAFAETLRDWGAAFWPGFKAAFSAAE